MAMIRQGKSSLGRQEASTASDAVESMDGALQWIVGGGRSAGSGLRPHPLGAVQGRRLG